MTAVEFLLEKWAIQGTLHSSDIAQALEMEKEQKHELKEKYFIKGYVGAELDNFIYDDSTELSAKQLFDELNKSE
tara:strand:+ start:39 stop:263 length:225 start_codon:yes stop_codon:yes gene_type:complete